MISLRPALGPLALLAVACAHATPPPPLSEPPFPSPRLVLRAPERLFAELGQPVRLAVRLRNEGNRWATVELDPRLLELQGREDDGRPLPCRAPARSGRGTPIELGPGAGRTLVVHLEDRCALSEPGRYTLVLAYRSPEVAGEGPYTVGPVEVRLDVTSTAPPTPATPTPPSPAPATPAPGRNGGALGDGPSTGAAPERDPSSGAAQSVQPPGGAAPGARSSSEAGRPTARQACIDRELARRGLNPFGDRPGTVYAGGTPVFDERTGRTEDRYAHVLARRPEVAAACPPADLAAQPAAPARPSRP